MGGCFSEHLSKAELEKQKEIEQIIHRDKANYFDEYRLLLLGAGESGKSTIVKQMKILYLNGFTDEELSHYREIIHSNVIISMRALLRQAEEFNMELQPANQVKSELFIDNNILSTQLLTPKHAQYVKDLWADQAIQQCLARASEFQINENIPYFVEKIDQITGHFTPTEEDILRSRSKTLGIKETVFVKDEVHFRIVDVGGQRSERKKWIHCFQDVTAIIFCSSLSEYDQRLFEDENVNRMEESLKLFEDVCNSKWFRSTPLILFLNKSDLMQEKITRSPLSACFPDYTGGPDYEKAVEFIKEKFLQVNKYQKEKAIYSHITCATDTNNIKVVFDAVSERVVNQLLDKVGF